MQKTLHDLKLSVPNNEVPALANWIWEDPARCPAMRLIDSIWDHMLRNRLNILDNDPFDFDALACVPYTNFSTLDGRMHEYLIRASRGLKIPYDHHVFRNLPLLVKALHKTNADSDSRRKISRLN
ncbi:MAG: hypothetical protein U1E27_08305 [Kiritimatiellia bacterium]|nr:hypothetical protein [Kiritimatiellia bacterium]